MDASEEREGFQEGVLAMFERPISGTAFYKDLPRLLSRFTITLASGQIVGPFESAEGGFPLEQIHILFATVARELEEESKELDNIERLAEEYTELHKGEADIGLSLPGLVEIYGEDSRTLRALKLVHQNLILYCMFELKTKVLKDIMTKDVRDRDGWLVNLTIVENVQLRHTRREQGVDPTQPFVLTWTVTITFDRNISEIGSVSLRVTHLDFNEGIDEGVKEELRRKLIGDIILA